MNPEWVAHEMLKTAVPDKASIEEPFTEKIMESFSIKYGFKEENLAGLALSMNFVSNLARHENKWHGTNLAAQRRKFSAVVNAGNQLLQALTDLDEDALFALENASWAQSIVQDQEVTDLFERDAFGPTQMIVPGLGLDGNKAHYLFRCTDELLALSELEKIISDLVAALTHARELSGSGKKGRREDDTLGILLRAAHLLFVNLTDKSFTLDWTTDNSPITDAACFCTDVCRVFDPDCPSSKIVTAARKVSKTCIEIKSLDEIDNYIRYFLKRSGWRK